MIFKKTTTIVETFEFPVEPGMEVEEIKKGIEKKMTQPRLLWEKDYVKKMNTRWNDESKLARICYVICDGKILAIGRHVAIEKSVCVEPQEEGT